MSNTVPRDRSESRYTDPHPLAPALRAAHGLGLAFELEIRSGATGGVSLRAVDPSSARWVTLCLVEAYGRNAWLRGRPWAIPADPHRRAGYRVRAWPQSLREGTDGISAAGSVAVAWGLLPPGSALHWRFRADAPGWHAPLRAVPGVTGAAPRNHSEGTTRYSHGMTPAEEHPTDPLYWRSTIEIEQHSGTGWSNERFDRAQASAEAALRTRAGNGIRFRRRSPFVRQGRPEFFVTDSELEFILPAPGEPSGSAESFRPLAANVPLGRDPAGRVIGIEIDPNQGRHLAILGETGMGKSSALVGLSRRVVTAGGLVVLDPLGETARAVREALPPSDLARVAWVSAGERAGGINALEGAGPSSPEDAYSDRRRSDLVRALRRVRAGRYDSSSFWGPRLEEILTRALRAASELPQGTLVDAHTLLATGGRARSLVPPPASDALRALVERIQARPEDAEGARRLLYEVVQNPVLRSMLCVREPTFHPSEVVAPGVIALISGDASAVGEESARYLLSTWLALVWSELLGRTERAKTFVLLDETHWYSHQSLAEMLRLARRLNVHVVLASQSVSSLPSDVVDAVWTNVSDFLAFRGSPEEARELARLSPEISASRLLSLPVGSAVVLRGKGHRVGWIRTARTPEVKPATGVPDPPSTISGELPVDRALAWIRERFPPSTVESARLRISELGRFEGDSGDVAREVGAYLGRHGAIVGREGPASDRVWCLDPRRIPGPDGEPRPSALLDATELPQPS